MVCVPQCKSHLESDETIFADKKREVDHLNETIKDMVHFSVISHSTFLFYLHLFNINIS